MIPLTVPELRRLLLALAEPRERFAFRLAWSRWRRRHQAVAQRGHRARRARRELSAPSPAAGTQAVVTLLRPPPAVALSEAEWQRIVPLLPPEKPRRGRPAHAHRPLVAAMLWVERTGASWRQIPAEVGPWQRVHNRYRLWRASGLWARILAAVEPPPASGATGPYLATALPQADVAA
jgi:hypothetical protein